MAVAAKENALCTFLYVRTFFVEAGGSLRSLKLSAIRFCSRFAFAKTTTMDWIGLLEYGKRHNFF